MGEHKRLSPDELDHILRNHVDAKNEEDALRRHIAALEAEISRLKPSGQVAEDAALLRKVLAEGIPIAGTHQEDDHEDALSRLAAKAQGYEAMIERCKVEITKAITAESERDAAVQRAEAAEGLLGNADATATAAQKREEAAVADNAALLELVRKVAGEYPGARACMGCYRALHTNSTDEHCPYGKAANAPHPGAALLEVANLLRQYQAPDEPDMLTTLKRILEERRR